MSVSAHRFRNVSAAILAGGKSSRMGSNKALLHFRGKRLITRV
jgi:molybdopterin-guanine dinucleotide biosynthesis protein A